MTFTYDYAVEHVNTGWMWELHAHLYEQWECKSECTVHMFMFVFVDGLCGGNHVRVLFVSCGFIQGHKLGKALGTRPIPQG